MPGCPMALIKDCESCQHILEYRPSASCASVSPVTWLSCALTPRGCLGGPAGRFPAALGPAGASGCSAVPSARGVWPGRQSRCRNAGLGGSGPRTGGPCCGGTGASSSPRQWDGVSRAGQHIQHHRDEAMELPWVLLALAGMGAAADLGDSLGDRAEGEPGPGGAARRLCQGGVYGAGHGWGHPTAVLCPSCWHVVTTPCASTAVDAGWGQAVLGGTERGDPLAHCPLPQPGCPTCPTYPARHCWARSLPAPSRWRDPAASSTATPMPPTPFGWRWPLPTVSARCSSTSPPGQGTWGDPHRSRSPAICAVQHQLPSETLCPGLTCPATSSCPLPAPT